MNVTYLLGAGASVGVLPCVGGLKDGFLNFSKDFNADKIAISAYATNVKQMHSGTFALLLNDLNDDITWLIKELEDQSSIDTFAKKLYFLNNRKDLKRLKALISVYFSYAQLNKKKDKRYDNFIASILGETNEDLPANLKILSWNYDFQLELSYSEFINAEHLTDSQVNFKMKFPNNKAPFTNDGFGVIKLNGTVGYITENNKFVYLDKHRGKRSDELHFGLLEDYNFLKTSEVESGVSFAWEEKNSIFMQSVIECTKETQILIVVGYSFPFFNRSIDRKLLKENMPNLVKVYIQSHPDTIADTRERFLAIRDDIDDIVLRTDLLQFTFPNEL